MAGAPVQWLKLPAWKSGDRGFEPHSDLQRNKMFLPRSHVRIQHYGEPPWHWTRGSVLTLRPPGLEFRIMCLEGSVISFISPSSGGSPGPVWPICAQRWPKTPFSYNGHHVFWKRHQLIIFCIINDFGVEYLKWIYGKSQRTTSLVQWRTLT